MRIITYVPSYKKGASIKLLIHLYFLFTEYNDVLVCKNNLCL
jgi:hypothetical protein